MKRKIIFTTVTFLIIGVIGIIASSVFHELGHAIFAIMFMHVYPENFHIGIESYVEINVINATDSQLAMVAIGSFIVPEIIYLALMPIKNLYFSFFKICIGSSVYVHIIFSVFVLFFGTNKPESFDIMVFQGLTNASSISISIILISFFVVNIIMEIKSETVKNIVIYFCDLLDS